jgi:hypothetical protein
MRYDRFVQSGTHDDRSLREPNPVSGLECGIQTQLFSATMPVTTITNAAISRIPLQIFVIVPTSGPEPFAQLAAISVPTDELREIPRSLLVA